MPPPVSVIHVSPPKDKNTRKRKKVDESPEVDPPRPVITVPPRSRLTRGSRAPVSTSPPSPAQSLSLMSFPSSSALFSPAPSDPPPSVISSARSAPPAFSSGTPAWSSGGFTAQSQGLEVRILRSQLDTANNRFEREQERSRLEVESLRAEFASEREVYQEYIRQLESALGQK